MATNLRYVSLKLSQAAQEAAAALSSATASLPEALQRGMEVGVAGSAKPGFGGVRGVLAQGAAAPPAAATCYRPVPRVLLRNAEMCCSLMLALLVQGRVHALLAASAAVCRLSPPRCCTFPPALPQAFRLPLTSVMLITGAAMAPTLNPKAARCAGTG